MKRTVCVVISVFCCLLIPLSASASNEPKEINVTVKITGNKIRGPKTIKLTHVNTLRYDVSINGTVSYPPGLDPTILKGIIPSIPEKAAEDAPSATTPATESGSSAAVNRLTAAFNKIRDDLNRLEDDWATLQNRMNEAITLVNNVRGETETFIRGTDNTLNREDGPQVIVNQLPGIIRRIEEAINRPYDQDPTNPRLNINALLSRLSQLKTNLETFRVNDAARFPAWFEANKPAMDRVSNRIDELQTDIRAVNRDSEQGRSFFEHQTWLRNWRTQLLGITVNSFSLPPFEADCSSAFSDNKETKIELVKKDRLGARDAEPTRQEIITVVCSSPLSISAGFGFSTVEEKEFMFIQSTKSVTDDMGNTTDQVINRFGFKNRSSFRTLPVLLLNTRFWEPNDIFAVHASAGAAVDVNTGEAGSDVEFIVGPSMSFWRTFFVTAGVHIGRVPSIVGGFEIGDEVPEGVNTTPVEKTWKKGFVVTFTYKIR